MISTFRFPTNVFTAVSNYGPLMNSEAMSPIAQKYCIYNINAPGQEEDSLPLPAG